MRLKINEDNRFEKPGSGFDGNPYFDKDSRRRYGGRTKSVVTWTNGSTREFDTHNPNELFRRLLKDPTSLYIKNISISHSND